MREYAGPRWRWDTFRPPVPCPQPPVPPAAPCPAPLHPGPSSRLPKFQREKAAKALARSEMPNTYHANLRKEKAKASKEKRGEKIGN